MRRDLRILLGTMAVASLAQWGPAVPEVLTRMDTFRLREVEVRGARFLTRDVVVDQLGVGPQTSIWTDVGVLRDRLLDHPMVLEARVTRRPPHGLLVTLEERQPIALAPTPTLEPVDADGHRLPLDPAAHRLDLPIIVSERTPPQGSRLFPEDVRELAAELDHLMNADTAFLQMVSSVRLDARGAIVARWSDPPVEFLLPTKASPARLREGLGALSNAISRTPRAVPDEIDLRFADQVVVRRGN
jgi:hypothetical protein